MKTKTNGTIKKQTKLQKVSNPTVNVKNREKLRKKLKGLLDKQTTPSPQSASQKKSISSSQNKNILHSLGHENAEVVTTKKLKESLLENVHDSHPRLGSLKTGNKKFSKSKVDKKKDPATTKNPKIKEVSLSEKKNAETKKITNKSKEKNNFATTNQSKSKAKRTFKKKLNKECPYKQQHPSTSDFDTEKQKSSKSKKKDTKQETIKIKSSKSKSNAPVANTPTQIEYPQGRGPLRPQNSGSEIDVDMDTHSSRRKMKQKIVPATDSKTKRKHKTNTEQALVRAEDEIDDSGSEKNDMDNSYFDFLFDKNHSDFEETTSCSTYSQEEYTEEESDFEYSDEETDYEYEDESSEEYDTEDDYFDYSSDFRSTDDESYHPPENHPEDVYIAKGTAVKYDMTTDDVHFDSDFQGAQIIEMPADPSEQNFYPEKTVPVVSKTNKIMEITRENDEYTSESDDSCPSLVPINTMQNDSEASYYSSSDVSHSCDGSCDCGLSDENIDFEEQYKPMTPEVIKGHAENIVEIETFFDITTNDVQKAVKNDSILEEITSSPKTSLKYKVFTINNEILSTDSLSNDSSKTRSRQATHNEISNTDSLSNDSSKTRSRQATHNEISITDSLSNDSSKTRSEQAQKEIDYSNQNIDILPSTKLSESAQKDNTETVVHVAKKAKIIPIAHPENDISSSKWHEETHKPNNFREQPKGNSTKKSNRKNAIKTLFFNAVNSNHVIVLLKDPLYIYGTVKLKLLAGCLEIFGYNPKKNEELEIFSPRGYSSLKIESSYAKAKIPLDEKELLSYTAFFIRNDLEEIAKNYDRDRDAIVILERNDRSKKVNMLRKYMVEHIFPNMNSIQSDRPFYTSEFLLRCIITPTSDNGLLVNPEWNTIPIQNNSKTILIGGKSVGKSTLLRYLINRSLNKFKKILLVDLDIGQPEMFVPQTISVTTLNEPLLGPGYFLNKQPDKSFLVGHYNIIQSLEPYIESLKALFEYCNESIDYKDVPWIVNTMGYNKGFGDELISVICNLLQPSNIVQFESGREINDFDVIMIKDNLKCMERNVVGDLFRPIEEFVPKHQLTLINSFIPKSRNFKNEWTMKPKDMRLAMILLRLSNTLIGHSEWMTDVKPLCASIDDINIIKMGDDQMDKDDLVKTLVGNLVYLCRFDSGKAHECFGIGIVRAVDYPLRQIYLLPSISHELLKNVNCLAICGTPLPSSILLKQGPKVKGNASYVYNTLDEAASMYIQQTFNKPQQFPSAKRKSLSQ